MGLFKRRGRLLKAPGGLAHSADCCCACCCLNTLPEALVLTFHRRGVCGNGSPEEGGNFDPILGEEFELHQIGEARWTGGGTTACGWSWSFVLRCDTEEIECPRFEQESNWFLDWEVALDPGCATPGPTSGTALTQGAGLAVATCDPFYAEFHIFAFEGDSDCGCCPDCHGCELFAEVTPPA